MWRIASRHLTQSPPKISKKRLVLFDHDGGIDDLVSLLQLLSFHTNETTKPGTGLKLLGVTCVSGNTTVENVAKSSHGMVSMFSDRMEGSIEEIPKIYRGATQSILKYKTPQGWLGHGPTGCGTLNFDDEIGTHVPTEGVFLNFDLPTRMKKMQNKKKLKRQTRLVGNDGMDQCSSE
ncbi:hypothetical protein RFI_01439 [Reticulomyxa filosa]|uniref:Inosine/uridine-preferring nucleoside hydrolase domain-containing protein n=1 Tax=Reticulomyxa filosa TaxID=46433 RepID=X6PAQ3_RETFI|nr:hypothetical protein RFI_01439 [Reticulomyxa filosa]|eukprot:ETO35620.1 hypothetical protein RFI_01439 [Reticulomyxa filosa]